MALKLQEGFSRLQWPCLVAAIAFTSLWPIAEASGDEVSRRVPPIYRERLAALLTPLEEAMRSAVATQAADYDGAIILDEEIHYIDNQGRRYIVDHRINKAFTESGGRENAEEVHGYRKANQKIHLVSAQTIMPDGKRLPVRPGAAILQSPQRQADQSLYDDQGELRLIFPNVKPGAVTESIVITEESQFRIPGEFTAAYSWAFGWPTNKIRRVIDMPGALAERLKVFTLGHQVPDVQKISLPKGETRFVWQSGDVDALPNERNRPPTLQAGPVLRLTTLPDWDRMVRWYAPLLQEKAKLKPHLEKQIDEWTQAARTPSEICEILMTRVARDVRYTGLEFGASDLQPHDCNDVWENQYGDCKDKANLLCAMLRHKGLTAHLVLVNTEHVGKIDQRCPDYRQFNHAITAVELEPGKYVFCDPTISYASPGLISPSDADRDVLLIKNGTAEWARTPPQMAGVLHYDLDLKMSMDGEISGWLTQETQGYYGVSDANYFMGLDKDSLRDRARDVVRGFFKAAEIVDVTKTPIDQWKGTHQLKAYFVVPGSGQEGRGQTSLAFPRSSSLFVDPGTQKKRSTPYYTWPDAVNVSARVKLPEGFAPAGLPRPFQVKSNSFDGSAHWSFAGNECQAALEMEVKQNLLQPEEFEIFYNAIQSLHGWLDHPLTIAVEQGTTPAPVPPGVTLEDFPMMPNGDGQLTLVEQRYPQNRDRSLRREALQKVIQYFPTDKPTLFTAGVRLAMMDWREEKAQQAIEQIDGLLRKYRSGIGVDDVAWGEYVEALALLDVDRSDDASKILEAIGNNSAVSSHWRAWSAYQRAKILEKKSATVAIKVLREALSFDAEARPAAFTLLAKLLIVDGRMADLKKEVRQLLDKKPPRFAAMLTTLAESAGDLLPAERATQREELLQLLESAQKTADLGKRFDDALASSWQSVRALTSSDRIRESLKKHLAKFPLPEIDKATAEFKSRADFSRAIDQAEKERKPELCIGYGVALLARFEPDADFPAYLWKATSHADWGERFTKAPEPLLPVLLDLCDSLPTDNDTYVDGRLLRARGCERRDDLDGALKIYEGILSLPKLSPGFKVTTHLRKGADLETLRAYPKALAVYREMEAEIEFVSSKDGLLRAAFLNLEMGVRPEALRLLGILAGRTDEAIGQASTGKQILEMVVLAKDPQKAAAYWDSSAAWWPLWLELERKLEMKPLGEELIVPAIPDLQSLGADAGIALRGKDRRGVDSALRMLAHGARWQPSMTTELFSLLMYVPDLIPDHAEEIRKFTIAVADRFVSNQPDLTRKSQMYQTIACIDTLQDEKALEIIHAFAASPRVDDGITHTMARLWALAAQRKGRDFPLAIAALKESVASPNLENRGLTVTSLANLYRLTGRADDEEKLLRREIENPRTKAVPADLQALTARYQQVSQAGEEARQFSRAIEKWLTVSKPAWFDFAEPKTLDDPRLSNLDTLLEDPSRIFVEPEIIKLLILVATSNGQSYERRQQAFLGASYRLMSLARTTDEARKVYDSLIDDPEAPEWLRIEALWRAATNARSERRAADLERLGQHPLVARFSPSTKGSMGILREALAVDTASSEAMQKFCERLLRQEMTFTAVSELREFYRRLLDSGQMEAAEKIYRQLSEVTIGADVNLSKASLQMEFLKALNRAKRWAPVGAAMRDLILAQYPAEAIQEPQIYAKLHDPFRLDWLDEKVAKQIFLYHLKTRQMNPEDLYPYKAFVQNLPRDAAHRKLTIDLIAAALKNAPGDNERAIVAAFGTAVVDNDDEELRSALAKILQPYRKAEENPATFAEIRWNELQNAVRLGDSVNFESDFKSLRNSRSVSMATYLQLRHYVQVQNIALIKKSVETIGPDELLGEQLLPIALRAFEMAGMNDELDLARDAARKAIYRNAVQSWATLRSYALSGAYELAEALHDTSGLPKEWIDYVGAELENRRTTLFITGEDSQLRKDWPRLFKIADEGTRAFPTYYHFHWFKGEALFHMGRREEALEALRIYTRFAKDELEYPQAMNWVKELESSRSSANSESKQPQ